MKRIERDGIPTYCSPVSWAEIFAGIRPGEEVPAEGFFHAHGVGIADALIAAAASTTGLQLWTLNRRHYPMDDVRFYEAASPAS